MKVALLQVLNDMKVIEAPTPQVDNNSVFIRAKTCAVSSFKDRDIQYGKKRVVPP